MSTNKTFHVMGMDCASCANIVKKKLQKIDGIKNINVSFASEKAEIDFDPSKTNVQKMNDELSPLGYSIMDHSEHMDHSNMSDVENHNHGGDHDHSETVSSDEKVKALKLQKLEKQKDTLKVLLPITFFSIIFMSYEILSKNLNLLPEMPEIVMVFIHHLMPLLAFYALFVVGQNYLRAMMSFLRYKVANMDTLVGIGTSVAFLYSFLLSAFEKSLAPYIDVTQSYYDVTIVVIGFITLGKYLEASAKLRTSTALEKLMSLKAKTARLWKDKKEVEVPIEMLKIDDVFIVKAGEKIATDGSIIDGSASIDEAMITGESLPIDKKIGDKVTGATINKNGVIYVKVEKLVGDSVLSQIIKMVEHAQNSKAPIEKLADQISAVFVPVILVFSFVILLSWLIVGSYFMPFAEALRLAILCFVGVLVIACPCAMGLATPVAVIVGVGKAAESGILIKDAESLEKLSNTTHVLFDKTGTLTYGKPKLTDIVLLNNSLDEKSKKEQQSKALQIIASLEKNSEHPIAKALVEASNEQNLKINKVDEFKVIEGNGIVGKINNEKYFATNLNYLYELKIDVPKVLQNFDFDTYTRAGKTPIFLSHQKNIVACFFVADTLKTEAKKTIEKIHSLGLKTIMLTGDHANTAKYIANDLDIDEVIAEVMPDQKANKVKELQNKGYKVVMVGDGINDAPALATANVGIAMGTGTDVAIESAGLTIMSSNLEKIVEALSISKATLRTIKQNLFWAFFYNVVSIPVASGILYPTFGLLLNPAIAGGAMAFSSISVVLNALRLKRQKWT